MLVREAARQVNLLEHCLSFQDELFGVKLGRIDASMQPRSEGRDGMLSYDIQQRARLVGSAAVGLTSRLMA